MTHGALTRSCPMAGSRRIRTSRLAIPSRGGRRPRVPPLEGYATTGLARAPAQMPWRHDGWTRRVVCGLPRGQKLCRGGSAAAD